ncbi:MAG: hypothetical protein D6820_02635 [Lentisphaerae bacterium]|nr:MAG: hypothetical protein D6820_02635 [Lentisphaerota bacterium]
MSYVSFTNAIVSRVRIITTSAGMQPAIVALCAGSRLIQAGEPPYRNPRLPIETRVRDLLARMPLAEKVDFLTGEHFKSDSIEGSGRWESPVWEFRRSRLLMVRMDLKGGSRPTGVP